MNDDTEEFSLVETLLTFRTYFRCDYWSNWNYY